MERNNRARRAARPPLTDPGEAANLWLVAAAARHDVDIYERAAVKRLEALPAQVSYREAERLLLDQVDSLWGAGWQPVELERQGRLGCPGAPARRLVRLAIAADDVHRRAASLDHRWRAQVDRLRLPATDGQAGWLERWAGAERLDGPRAVDAVVSVLANLLFLPVLEPLLPLPGQDGGQPRVPASLARVGRAGGADPVLQRIRGLLAKAESTTFEAEATSLTAKAHELMTRHAIDAARVQGTSTENGPSSARIPVDPPYADAKSFLLQTIAEASRCRAVFQPATWTSTLVGYGEDIAAVEMLFTSLLVQVQRWLSESARGAAPGSRTRGQSYRSAFLVAFAHRIGERLRESNEALVAEVADHESVTLLPVLQDRSAAVDDYVTESFGDLTTGSIRGGYDSYGYAGGRMAADNARLAFGDLERR